MMATNSTMTAPTLYDAAFYQSQSTGSERSAEIVLPLVQSLLGPEPSVNTVIDVGCGVGTWLKVWQQLGVTQVLGLDGSYVDRTQLRIPDTHFCPHDLTQPLSSQLSVDLPADLVMSLEVAEHLPASRADSFVADLVRLGPVILFSAAIPHQGGKGHINEQWPNYWAERFANHGYVAIDCLRSQLWTNKDVAWWYAQNLLLFVAKDQLSQYPALASLYNPGQEAPLSLIHPTKYNAMASAKRQTFPKKILKRLKRTFQL